ncbi:hypothetical protein PybrP1_005116 [[Pythium] brassicae (nom. inval.)]|nr:hypothetical protein PybrP1_005116 [[Pythium] brassicae (nom. inval.)]
MPAPAPAQVGPLASVRFDPVRLSPAQTAAYEILLRAQLADALREYDASYARGLGAAGGAQLAAPWKRAGTVGRLTTYKVAGASGASALSGATLQSYRTFGQVQGFYRDILDAHHAESSADLRNLQKLLFPDTLDAAVLHTVRSERTARPREPPQQHSREPQLSRSAAAQPPPQCSTVREQYFGIKWVASASPSADIRRRDCCYVEMLGYARDCAGRDVAFCATASVALPECPELRATHALTRVRVRQTMLLAPTQDAQATTEVFVAGVREVTDASLGTNAHHRHAMAVLNDISLVIDSRNLAAQRLRPRSEWVPDARRAACWVCSRPFSFFFRRKHHCRLCGDIVCRTCYVKRAVPSPGAGPAMADDKFCVRCIVELRAADRCLETFSQQIHKANTLRVLGRDSSISSDVSVALPMLNSGSSQLSSLSSSEILGSLSEHSSFSGAEAAAAASAIVYYKRGSQQKKVLRLDELIKFPVEPQPDENDDDDDERRDMRSRVQAKRANPIRLLSNDASMVELYNRLVRLSQSGCAAGSSSARSGGVGVVELRRSIAGQELLLGQLRQSLAPS